MSTILRRLRLASLSLAGFLAATAAHATQVGLSTDPMGSGWNRGDANTAFSLWDIFPGDPGGPATFANWAAQSGSGFLGTPYLSQLVTGPLRTGSGDRIYTAGSSPTFSIDVTTSFAVKGFTLQMKQYQAVNPLSFELLPTLNGITADFVMTEGFTEGANFQHVTTWFWGSSLASQNFTTINLEIADQTGNHYSVDAIVIDAGTVAVPEPTAVSLLGGAGLLFLMRRRRGPVAIAS